MQLTQVNKQQGSSRETGQWDHAEETDQRALYKGRCRTIEDNEEDS